MLDDLDFSGCGSPTIMLQMLIDCNYDILLAIPYESEL